MRMSLGVKFHELYLMRTYPLCATLFVNELEHDINTALTFDSFSSPCLILLGIWHGLGFLPVLKVH